MFCEVFSLCYVSMRARLASLAIARFAVGVHRKSSIQDNFSDSAGRMGAGTASAIAQIDMSPGGVSRTCVARNVMLCLQRTY